MVVSMPAIILKTMVKDLNSIMPALLENEKQSKEELEGQVGDGWLGPGETHDEVGVGQSIGMTSQMVGSQKKSHYESKNR